MFSYFSSLITTPKQVPTGEQILAMLWYSQKVDKIMDTIDKLTKLNETTPLTFLKTLTTDRVSKHTSEIIVKVLQQYNTPKWGVCKFIADYLDNFDTITTAYSIAIGTEKCKWNIEFYHKIRVLKSLELSAWRKLLNEKRQGPEFVVTNPADKTAYTLGLFNEPLNQVIVNPSDKNPIISVYKKMITLNSLSRTPIEIPLDVPFQQSNFHSFISIQSEPVVIVTKYIGPNVVPPKGIFLLFIESTESYSPGIYPYVANKNYNSLVNLFEMM